MSSPVPNLLSWCTASFVNDAIRASLKKDFFVFPDWGMDASAAGRLFEREWSVECARAQAAAISDGAGSGAAAGGGGARKVIQPSLKRALWRAFSSQFILAAGLKLAWGFLVLVGVAYFVREVLAYIRFRSSDPEHTLTEEAVGIGLCLGFLACMLLLSLAIQQMTIVSARLGLRVESALAAAVYKKSLTYDRAAYSADVTSLVANDCAKINSACTMLQYLWSGAVEAIAILLILVGFVQRAALPGLGVVLLIIPVQYWLGTATASARKATVVAADKRVRLTDEVLRSIKLVKMYVWETMFAKSVAEERAKEVSIQAWAANLKSINFAIVFAAPPLIALSIFGVRAIEAPLEATLAFTTLSLFNTLRLPLVQLPKGLNALVEALSSVTRITAFLVVPDRLDNKSAAESSEQQQQQQQEKAAVVVVDVASPTTTTTPTTAAPAQPPRGTLELEEASFAYGVRPAVLKRVSLRCAPGSLTIVTGMVGSGKSNLLLAALGQMTTVGGSVTSSGSFAYVPQTPWCAAGTVRDNILFGKAWDERRYRAVIFACALERDLELFEGSDLLEIGERGMNLSGGQRQRIAIARAVYSGADIVLLDSPLSAVDAYTSQHIFEHAITGILQAEGATVVLVTHQVELFQRASQLVILRDGEAAYIGQPTSQVLREHFQADKETAADEANSAVLASLELSSSSGASTPTTKTRSPSVSSGAPLSGPGEINSMQQSLLKRTFSLRAGIVGGDTDRRTSRAASQSVVVASQSAAGGGGGLPASKIAAANSVLPLASPEEAAAALETSRKERPSTSSSSSSSSSSLSSGSSFSSYAAFARNLRWPTLIAIVGIFLVTQLTRIFSDIWISSWVSKVYKGRSEEWYISVYSGYVAAFLVLLYLRGIAMFAMFRSTFSRMHDKMFRALLRAPLSYYVQTPLGSVTSVVSKDMDEISDALTGNMYLGLVYIMILFTTIGVVVDKVRIFLAVLLPLFIVFLLICARYLAASQGLKAQAGAATSTIFAHVAETRSGVAVIQAFRAERRYTADYEKKLFAAQNARFTMETLQLWLSVRQDLVGSLLVFATCIMVVSFEKSLSPAAAGLAVSNSFQILLFLSLMVRTLSSAHDAMGSVDRVRALGTVSSEADASSQEPPPNWPPRGEIEFRSVCMSYLPAAPYVLKGVSFNIVPGEKIGIVGRTGAGKSSLIQALFRLAPASEGTIRVDGIDTSQLALHALRKSIAILPQEPVMFEGTLRSNLDPFLQRKDEELLDALDKCLLQGVLDSHPLGLLQPVESCGANFSLGQQQLVCLARALLNESTVLLLDEATAALDAETDAKVQRILRRCFASRTILTIAHRIDTIIDSDRILVMDSGRVAEFAPPSELLTSESLFTQLCRQSGAGSFATLRAAADRHAAMLLALQGEVSLVPPTPLILPAVPTEQPSPMQA